MGIISGKLNFSSPVSYRAGLVTSLSLALAMGYEFANLDIAQTSISLALVLSVLSAAMYMVGKLIKNLDFSDFLNAGGALLLISAGAMLALSPGAADLTNIWWFIAVFAASTMGFIVAISALLLMLIFIFVPSSEIVLSDQTTVTFILGTVAAALSGGLIASGGNTERKTKSKGAKLQEQIDADELLASIADGIIVVDNENKVRVFNKAAAEVTGWSNDDVDALDFHSVMKLVDGDGNAINEGDNPFSKIIKGGGVIKDDDLKLKTRSDKQIDISLIASPIKNEADKTEAVVGIFRDITQEKHEAQQRAEFISTASHEMRTPVAAIEGYLALALNDRVSKIDSKARDYLDKAHASTQHLGKLFQDLLTAAKSEDGRLTNHPQVVDVGAFLDELIEGARFTAEKKGLLLEDETKNDGSGGGIEVVRPLAYIHVDPDRMREVITNLFDNAVKYTEEGKITIGLHVDDKDVTISVKDTGAGIPKEDIPHLFQKFYRVDNTATRQVGGTGLGLFICRKIVELYKGRIWAESELNEGSTFFVAIPRLSPEQASAMQRTTQVPDVPVTNNGVIDATGGAPKEVSATPESDLEAKPAPEPVVTAEGEASNK